MKSINYLTGDATRPIGDGPKMIIHVCNDIGKWGKGFVLAISRTFGEKPKIMYQNWQRNKADFRGMNKFRVGAVQFCDMKDDIWIANMIAQNGVRSQDNPCPINYDALRTCLVAVRWKCRELGASVHAPRIGAGLAGGKWSIIEKIIQEELVDNGIEVTIYDL